MVTQAHTPEGRTEALVTLLLLPPRLGGLGQDRASGHRKEMIEDSLWQTVGHEPHAILWPLECGSSTKYQGLAKYFEEVALDKV